MNDGAIEVTDDQFVKIYQPILESSVWVGQALHVKVLWIVLLIKCNASGNVMSSIPGLAQLVGCSIPQVLEALNLFLAPDPYSRTKDHEGRRIKEIDGGWHVFNHWKYANKRTRRQALNAKRQREFKDRQRSGGEVEPAAYDVVAPSRRELGPGVTGAAASVTSVTSVTGNESNGQISDLRSEISDPKALESGPKELTGNARAHESNGAQGAQSPHSDPPTVTSAGTRTYFVPEHWQPTETHRHRAIELGLDFDAQLEKFRLHEFERPYSNWDNRFALWLGKARTLAEADAFTRQQQQARPRSRVMNGAAQLQPDAGLTGFEGVREFEEGDR